MSTEKVLFVEIRSAEENQQTELIALIPRSPLAGLLQDHYGRTFEAWVRTLVAATESGAMPLRDKEGYPITGDGMHMYDVYVSIGDLWRYLQKADFPLEKSPAALWVRLRPEFAGPLPAWLMKHRPPKTPGKRGPKPDASKNQAYLHGYESIPQVAEELAERLGKRPTQVQLAEELAKRFRPTSASIWKRDYLTGNNW